MSSVDHHAVEVLDFQRIRELLAEGARTPQGAELCLGLQPAGNRGQAEEALSELQALAELEPRLGMPPTAGLQRIDAALETARVEGACLDADTFVSVRGTVAACHRVLEYLEDARDEGSPLGVHAEAMSALYDLEDRFERTFGPRGEILDGASLALQRIRGDLRRLRDRVLKTLEGVLRNASLEHVVQDDFVTVRGDRYVIPLRTDFRGHLPGIIHDRSNSGATFFVEPLETVELNNQRSLLREEEEEEVRRILRELTGRIGAEATRIRRNVAVAAALDFVGACLRLAQGLRGTRPVLVDAPNLRLQGARHPLLHVHGGAEVVPVDLVLGDNARLLLITGANAGGKTVALKTAGLLVLMARAGLYVPADEGSVVGWFRGVYADIGDEQDIDRNLSTFSAHVEHLRDILETAGEGSLVLLDELGTGTDPNEGAALAQAVLEALLERGVRVVATTHLTSLKVFVFAQAGAQNAAVAFDPATGRPQYRLVYGHAGSSNALEMAARLGLPEEIVARARAFATAGSDAAGELLRAVEEARESARREAGEAENLRRRWEAKLADQETVLSEARRMRDAAKAEARAAAREMIAETRESLREVVAAFARRESSQQSAQGALRAAEKKVEAALRAEEAEQAPAPVADLSPGTPVFIPSLGKEGIVESLTEGGRRAVVRVGTLRTTVPGADLRGAHGVSGPGRPRPAAPPVRVQAEGGSADLVVVGCSVEEALARVDKALDRALLGGVGGFRVVHGRGTGTLRRAIRERLSAQPQVRSVRSPEGDDAVTWVELE